MRNPHSLTLAFVFSILLAVTNVVWAVPITGGTGPGGVGMTDGTSNLQAWFKADALILTGGDPVSTWTDSSGKSNDALSSLTLRPTYTTGVQNGLPVVRFDGSNDSMTTGDTGAYNLDQAYTTVSAFSVDTFGTAPGHRTLFGIGNDAGAVSDRRLVNLAFEATLETHNRLAGGDVNHATNLGVGSFRTLANRYLGGGATTANYSLRVDGTLAAATGGTALLHNFQSGELYLGDAPPNQTGFPNLDGDIAEIAFYNRDLTDAELIIIDNYLAAKYDKTASGSGAINNDFYAGDEVVNGDYDSDVFGIGQESGLAFSSSGSAGFGIEAVSGLDDGEFMLAGHKVASNTELDYRWDRTWFLDNQLGGDELLNLAFDWSDADLGTANPDFVKLIYSSTDGGPLFTVAVGSLVGDTVTFTGLAAGDLVTGYYTLGVLPVPEPSSFLLLGLGALGLARHTRGRKTA